MKDGNLPTENVVPFPQGKREKPVVKTPTETHDDPLESLLNEFEEISKELDEQLHQKSIPVTKALESLPQTTTQALLPEDLLAREFSKSREFQARIELLHEVNKRIKFYIDEIELFLPKIKD